MFCVCCVTTFVGASAPACSLASLHASSWLWVDRCQNLGLGLGMRVVVQSHDQPHGVIVHVLLQWSVASYTLQNKLDSELWTRLWTGFWTRFWTGSMFWNFSWLPTIQFLIASSLVPKIRFLWIFVGVYGRFKAETVHKEIGKWTGGQVVL